MAHVRHGPFDIQGGGAWPFGSGRGFFFGQNRSKIIFFAGVTTNNESRRIMTGGHYST